jgi:hypothetical protein
VRYDDERATYRTFTDKASPMSQFTGPQFDHPACAETDPELWHPTEDGKKDPRTKLAIAIYQGCHAKHECLEWALDHKETGIWGGLLVEERNALLKKRKKAAAA